MNDKIVQFPIDIGNKCDKRPDFISPIIIEHTPLGTVIKFELYGKIKDHPNFKYFSKALINFTTIFFKDR